MKYIRRLLKKLPYLRNMVREIRELRKPERDCSRDITEMRMSLVNNSCSDYSKEVDYIMQHLDDQEEWFVPYQRLSSVSYVKSGYDWKTGLPYVEHKGKKLFFPAPFNEDFCIDTYKAFIDKECILGGNYREKQPHQYESINCMVDSKDILVDIGCAEALFALEHIDEVSKVYLIESDAKWIPPLRATFRDYSDKVVIVNKQIAGVDSEKTITLETLLAHECPSPFFVKMDIEGAETEVLNNSRKFLSSIKHIKMAVCTYHRKDDAVNISSFFNELGFKYEFSEGFMYLYKNCDPVYPYFRHGVIRGWK